MVGTSWASNTDESSREALGSLGIVDKVSGNERSNSVIVNRVRN